MRCSFMVLVSIFAAAAWPLGDIALANGVSEVSWIELAQWLCANFLIFITLVYIVNFFSKSYLRSTAIVTPLAIAIFSFSIVEASLQSVADTMPGNFGAVALFVILFIMLAIWLARTSGNEDAALFLASVPIVMLLLTGCFLVIQSTYIVTDTKKHNSSIRFASRPNVYHFLFDGMGRKEVIQAKLGIDVGNTNKDFESLGFVVPADVRAQYPSTWQSIESFLNLGTSDGRMEPPDIGGSSVVNIFRQNGYHYVRYGEVFRFAACSGEEDKCLSSKPLNLSEFSINLIKRTPLFNIARRLILTRTSSRHMDENLMMVANTKLDAPSYTFSYMVPPHPPFIFSKNCKADQEDYDDFRAWRKGSESRYGDAYRCVVSSIKKAAKRIIATDPSAIIIVSGDHGTMFGQQGYIGRSGGIWTPGVMAERMPVFLAIRAPATCNNDVRQIRRLADIYLKIFHCL